MLGRMDVLIHNADMVATMDDSRREILGGWVALTGNVNVPGVQSPATSKNCVVPPEYGYR